MKRFCTILLLTLAIAQAAEKNVAPAAPAASTPSSFGEVGDLVGWASDCSSTKDWYDNKTDPSFQAKIEQKEPSVLTVTQEGSDTWGKVAFVLKNVDLDKTPILEVKVNKVDLDSAFKVAVAPLDWSEMPVVIDRSSADGMHIGDIKAATGWSGKKDFCVVLVIEGKGKSTWFDNIKVASKK